MSENSAIEWCDSTFNSWIGCSKVSPGCDNCYAERERAVKIMGIEWGTGKPRHRTAESTWRQPLRWNRKHEAFFAEHGRRQRVFCASLSDVFDNEVPDSWRQDLFKLIADTPNLDWILLTKRIGNVRPYMQRDGLAFDLISRGNVQLGITVTTQPEADRDIEKLLATPARTKILSIEPLLSAIDISDFLRPSDPHCKTGFVTSDRYEAGYCNTCAGYESDPIHDPAMHDHIDGVFVGGESGPGSRPMHPDWVQDLRDQCEAAGVPFLFKQWGDWKPINQMTEDETRALYRPNRIAREFESQDELNDSYGQTCKVETDAIGYGGARGMEKAFRVVKDGSGRDRIGMQVFRLGKRVSGRTLDGRLYDGFPVARTDPRKQATAA